MIGSQPNRYVRAWIKGAQEIERLTLLEWRTLNDIQPTADDANEHGDIEWSDGKDIWQKHWTAYGPGSAIASHWRPITLPQVTK